MSTDASPGDESDDLIRLAAQQAQQNALIPLVEDLSSWLNQTLSLLGDDAVQPETFMESLENGVLMCSLIQKIQLKQNNPHKEKIKYRKAVTSGWHSRDNAATFLLWCKHLGLKQEVLFESEGLVGHKQKREVVLCLLELSRVGWRYGIEPPSLIKLEKEIEREEKMLNTISKVPEAAMKRSDLDSEIRTLTGACRCQPEMYVEKLKDGIYVLGNKRCLIRKFKTKHIMVRVGGGWDTLEHFLTKHDPCRIAAFTRSHNVEQRAPSASAANEHRFVHVQARYERKSTS